MIFLFPGWDTLVPWRVYLPFHSAKNHFHIQYKYILLDNDIYDSHDPPTPTDPHNFQIYPNLHVIGITHSQYIPSIGDESGG